MKSKTFLLQGGVGELSGYQKRKTKGKNSESRLLMRVTDNVRTARTSRQETASGASEALRREGSREGGQAIRDHRGLFLTAGVKPLT